MKDIHFYLSNAKVVVSRFNDFFCKNGHLLSDPSIIPGYFDLILMFLSNNSNNMDLANSVSKEVTTFIQKIGS